MCKFDDSAVPFVSMHAGEYAEHAFRHGAAVAFGIVGWGIALRENAPRLVKRSYWASEIDGAAYYDCFCPGCGCQMKKRTPGVDEGTDREWCGVCRY